MQITITTNAEQDAAIAAVLEHVESHRSTDENPEPTLAPAEYLKARFDETINSLVIRGTELKESKLSDTVKSLDPADRTAIQNFIQNRIQAAAARKAAKS